MCFLLQSFRFGSEIAYVSGTILQVAKNVEKFLVGGKQNGKTALFHHLKCSTANSTGIVVLDVFKVHQVDKVELLPFHRWCVWWNHRSCQTIRANGCRCRPREDGHLVAVQRHRVQWSRLPHQRKSILSHPLYRSECVCVCVGPNAGVLKHTLIDHLFVLGPQKHRLRQDDGHMASDADEYRREGSSREKSWWDALSTSLTYPKILLLNVGLSDIIGISMLSADKAVKNVYLRILVSGKNAIKIRLKNFSWI